MIRSGPSGSAGSTYYSTSRSAGDTKPLAPPSNVTVVASRTTVADCVVDGDGLDSDG